MVVCKLRNNLIIIFITLVLITLASILQSTFFNYIAIAGIKPDITLIILVYISFKTGSNNGQIVGFTSGLLQDILTSSTPLGFFACIRTILGFLFGLFEGAFTIDPILMPIVFTFIATLLKDIFIWLFEVIF
jgi:rod shape-determining protein MreD